MAATTRSYPFGTRISRVITPAFAIMVSTAKEGMFQKQSTVICLLAPPRFLDRGAALGKITWASACTSTERLQLHDLIVEKLDSLGTADMDLIDTLDVVVNAMRVSGNATQFEAYPGA